MDQAEINNWKTIAESMESKGDMESWFYLRARAIADGKPDPMRNIAISSRSGNSGTDVVRSDPFLGGVEALGKSDFLTSPPRTLK